jgi:hypothetical protein
MNSYKPVKNLLSKGTTNAKTSKNDLETYILYLAPANTIGQLNLCPFASEGCKKSCLYSAGRGKFNNVQQARINKAKFWGYDRKQFYIQLTEEILKIDTVAKRKNKDIAIRLNGTSDIAWENVDFTIEPEFATFCRVKFGQDLPIGKRNIFEVFNYIANNGGPKVQFYDYTKIKRNWAECTRLGYHLTFSFDGWENAANLKICRDALQAGVNVAAAFSVKRGQSLPDCIDGTRFNLPQKCLFTGGVLAVLDGDLTDHRPSDTSGGHIVGLRFKLPHGIKYSESDKQAFCIA